MTPEQFAKTLIREMKRVAVWSDILGSDDLKEVTIDGEFDMLRLAETMLRYFELKGGLFYVDDLPVGVVTTGEPTRIKGKNVAG